MCVCVSVRVNGGPFSEGEYQDSLGESWTFRGLACLRKALQGNIGVFPANDVKCLRMRTTPAHVDADTGVDVDVDELCQS